MYELEKNTAVTGAHMATRVGVVVTVCVCDHVSRYRPDRPLSPRRETSQVTAGPTDPDVWCTWLGLH